MKIRLALCIEKDHTVTRGNVLSPYHLIRYAENHSPHYFNMFYLEHEIIFKYVFHRSIRKRTISICSFSLMGN